MKKILYLLIFVALLWGCPNTMDLADLGGESSSAALLSLMLSAGGAKKILPPEISPHSYTITVSNGAEQYVFDTSDANPTYEIAAGIWDITVEGKDIDGYVIASGGEAGVVLTEGSTTYVSIVLSALTGGSGSIDVTVDWSAADSVTVSTVDATLDGAAIDPSNLEIAATSVRYTEDKDSGSYMLIFYLQYGGASPVTVAEAVQVYDNLTSSATIYLDNGDFTSTPSAPTDLSAVEAAGQIDLSWTDNSNVETGYVIERSVDDNTNYSVLTDPPLDANTESYSDADVTAGTTYCYRVKAVNSYGDSDYSDEVSVNFYGDSVNPDPPASTVRLVFIHHSTGNNWLNTGNGNLGDTLGANNYYVRDTYYGWDAPYNTDIGSITDIGHWYTWFADETVQGNGEKRRDNIMGALYSTDNQNASYTPITDPGGENEIIMFKSCFPNSAVQNDNSTQPEDLYGQPASSSAHTISNTKEVYRQILEYFKSRTDKLFVVITAPPLVANATNSTEAANARALNNWLVENWLSEGSWEDQNVYVFDFFNVLTDANNHHRVNGQQIEHIIDAGSDNYSAYGISSSDSHPNSTGNQKATDEFVPLLNCYYNKWKGN